MKARLLTTLGFALSTIAIITFLHVQKSPGTNEALDGILSGAYFTLIFATGLFGGIWIFNLRPAPMRAPVIALITGLNCGLLSWFLIYALWLLPWSQQPFLAAHAFTINSVFIFCVGVVMNKLPLYKIKKEVHQSVDKP